MSDRAGDIVLIGGVFMAIWGWLKLRAMPKGTVTIDSVTMTLDDGTTTTYTPPAAAQFTPSAPFSPELVSSFFMPSMTQPGAPSMPSMTQPGAPSAAPAIDPVEKDYLARTCWGEARGEGKAGQRAVASVILNRVSHRRYPSTVQGVALQRAWVQALGRHIYQFSMWDPLDHNEQLARSVTTADAQFRSCLEVAEEALSGRLSDPTGGATMYYSPSAMPAGRKPAWDFSKLRQSAVIGKHVFFVEL